MITKYLRKNLVWSQLNESAIKTEYTDVAKGLICKGKYLCSYKTHMCVYPSLALFLENSFSSFQRKS